MAKAAGGRDREAFQTRYPQVDPSLIAGQFTGSLDNGGERITVVDADGTRLIDFTYDDDAPWPRQADGLGPSLELIDPANTSRSEQGEALRPGAAALWSAARRVKGARRRSGFRRQRRVDSVDINLLYQALRSANPDPRFDLTGDGRTRQPGP